MVVNLATPQYTVQDLTYRNKQGRTAPSSFLDQTELELKAQRAKKLIVWLGSFLVCNFRYLEIQLIYYLLCTTPNKKHVCKYMYV